MFSFLRKPFPNSAAAEMNGYVGELIEIGRRDDFLSERPGGSFDRDCRHIRTREIGQRIFEIGGADAMEWTVNQVAKALTPSLGDHLEAAWARIGNF